MPLTTTFESSKHWDLGKVMRRGPSLGNSIEGDNHFSFKRLVDKARRGRTSGGDGDAPPPPPPKDGPKRSFSPSFYSASQCAGQNDNLSIGLRFFGHAFRSPLLPA